MIKKNLRQITGYLPRNKIGHSHELRNQLGIDRMHEGHFNENERAERLSLDTEIIGMDVC